jgi:hypothetical protein
LTAQNALLLARIDNLTALMSQRLTLTTDTEQIIGAPKIGISLNAVVVSFAHKDRLFIPVSLVRAAFTENFRLVEYCSMKDSERQNMAIAAPYVLEALVDLVRRVHKNPAYRNIYLSPSRADQAIVCLDSTLVEWEARPLTSAIHLLFDEVANNLQRIIISSLEREQLSFEIHSAAAWVPSLYGRDPERFVQEGRAAMAAHLANTRP